MISKENRKLQEIDTRLRTVHSTYQAIFPVWNLIDRKKKMLEQELKFLDDEKLKLTQGQMVFDGSLEF